MKPVNKMQKNSPGKPGNYPGLLSEVKERIRSAQYEALKAVNKELVGLYWDIGRMIVNNEGRTTILKLKSGLSLFYPILK